MDDACDEWPLRPVSRSYPPPGENVYRWRRLEAEASRDSKARELAEKVDDVEALLRMLWAQWSMEHILGEYRAILLIIQYCNELAHRTGDPPLILVTENFYATALIFYW